jgi:hypothetical protein
MLAVMPASGNAATPSRIPLKPDAIIAAIKHQGAKAVVNSLYVDDSRWRKVMTDIGSGDPSWLKVAIAIYAGSDAGASEQIQQALFIAIKPAPHEILLLIKKDVAGVDCHANLVDDYSETQTRQIVKDRIRVVEGLSDPSLQIARAHCLAQKREILPSIDRFYGH